MPPFHAGTCPLGAIRRPTACARSTRAPVDDRQRRVCSGRSEAVRIPHNHIPAAVHDRHSNRRFADAHGGEQGACRTAQQPRGRTRAAHRWRVRSPTAAIGAERDPNRLAAGINGAHHRMSRTSFRRGDADDAQRPRRGKDPPPAWSSLVTYSQRPSRDTAMPTTAWPSGTAPT